MYWCSDSLSKITVPSSVAFTVPTGIAIAAASATGSRDEAPAEPGGGDQREQQREGEEGPLGADERDQDERREHRAEQRADGRDRVEPPGDAAGVLDVGDREPDRPRRAGAEQHDRDRDQEEDGEQRADEGAGLDLVEGVDGEVEEGLGDERDQRQQHRAASSTTVQQRLRRSGRRSPSRPPSQ